MSLIHNGEMSFNNGRSKAFLLGLYIGLSLLLLVSHLDPQRDSQLHVATNIYGLQALAEDALGAEAVLATKAACAQMEANGYSMPWQVS
jgi:hypothetical protein